jgi:hypothetical protein
MSVRSDSLPTSVPPALSRTSQLLKRGRLRNLLIAVALVASACGSKSTPTSSTPTVTSLSILGSPQAQADSTGYQFIAQAQYSNASISDVTTLATWTTSNAQVASFATVGGRPIMTAFARGTITVTATYSGKSATMTVTVI